MKVTQRTRDYPNAPLVGARVSHHVESYEGIVHAITVRDLGFVLLVEIDYDGTPEENEEGPALGDLVEWPAADCGLISAPLHRAGFNSPDTSQPSIDSRFASLRNALSKVVDEQITPLEDRVERIERDNR